jgi:hypothetical protein
MKKALSLILVCLFLVSMMIPVSAAQFINAYETIQAENYSEASCASVLGLGSTHYLENCLDAGGGKNVFDWQRNTYFKYANVYCYLMEDGNLITLPVHLIRIANVMIGGEPV